MSFKAGDKVKFLHEKGEGIVIRFVSTRKVIVELTEGIEIEVDVKELVAIAPISLADIPVKYKDAPGGHSKHKSQPKSKPHSRDEWVVDLHAEKLSGYSYSQSNQQKLSMQLDFFQEHLEKAIRSHVSKIIFVHGVGNGVLRQSIRDILKRYDGIEFSDGSYQKFGAGATEVRILSRNRFKESF